jgi:putative inorganic carbon (hco3(-)) transporter
VGEWPNKACYTTTMISAENSRRAITWSFTLLLITLPFIWTSSTSELFEFPKMLTVYAFTGLITGLWLTRMILSRSLILAKTFLDWPLMLFLTSQILSTLFSIDPHTSLWGYYSRFHGGLVSTFAYLLLYYAAVSNLPRIDLTRILKWLLVAAGIATFYAFLEHYGHSFSCFMITGQFNVDCWVQDVQTRVFGTFGQPNWLAAYLVTIFFIPLSLATRHQAPGTKRNWLLVAGYWLLTTLFFLTLLFTKSRSGVLGLATGFAIFIPLTLLTYRPHLKSTLLKLVAGIWFLVTLFAVFGQGILPQLDKFSPFSPRNSGVETSYTEPRTSYTPQLESGGTESGKIREIVWKGAIELWKKYPILGSGVETFAYAYYGARPVEHNLVSEWDFLYNKAHNEFLNFLSTTGLVGLASYLAIILTFTIWSIKRIFRIAAESFYEASAAPHKQARTSEAKKMRSDRVGKWSDAEPTILLIALLSGFIALAVSNFFGFSTVPVALLFFLFPAFAHIASSQQTIDTRYQTPVTRNGHTLSQKILLTLILILTGYWFLVTGNYLRADIAYNTGKKALDQGDLIPAINSLQTALSIRSEPLYYDSLSLAVAQTAVSFAQTEAGASQAQQFAQKAVEYSQAAIGGNNVHLNFYKSQIRVFIALSAIDPQYVNAAQQSLVKAIQLAPTDAKLWYNLGLLYDQLDKKDVAQEIYEKTIDLKPNYEAARMSLAILYEASAPAKAREQYDYVLTRINPNNKTAIEKLSD